MIDAFVSGLIQVFTWPTFGLMLIGIVVGFAVGILPGIGGPTTLALMMPFLFTMTPVGAFAFLLGMISVTSTTGDITSVLFGIPGEATTAATILDGHPMAKKGQAGRALGIVLSSSLVGAVFGALVLALSIPIVRPLVLSFGSPELFMLAILGISFLSCLGGRSVLKGLIMGGFGLLLSMIGMEYQSGQSRYTFGQPYLWDGLSVVPVVVGLFAIPEIIDLAVKRSSIAEARVGKVGGVMEGVKDTFRHWGLTLRCSAIGAFFGIMPGIGSGVSQWIVYAHARQTSRDKEEFGKGAVEGVIGPGAANNSSIAAALIPTVAFGIPGGTAMAVLLGAFSILGLAPGPDMLTKHLAVTFSMVWVIIVANIITVAVSFLFLGPIIKLTYVKGTLLIPFILLLVYLGSITAHNDFTDVVVTLVFGILGTAMVWLDWPRPPFILGLVLGNLAENYLYISIVRFGADWLWRPMVIVILILTAAVVLYPVWQGVKSSAAKQRAAVAKHPGDIVIGALIVLISAFAVFEARGWQLYARLFPWGIGFPLLALAFTQLVLDLLETREKAGHTIPSDVVDDVSIAVARHRTISMSAWILGSFLAIWLLGFSIAVPLFTFVYLKIESREDWWLAILLAAVAWGFLFGLFDQVLHLPFPQGMVFVWLGF